MRRCSSDCGFQPSVAATTNRQASTAPTPASMFDRNRTWPGTSTKLIRRPTARGRGEAEVDRQAPALLLVPTVGIGAGEGEDERRLAVVDVPGGGDDPHRPGEPRGPAGSTSHLHSTNLTVQSRISRVTSIALVREPERVHLALVAGALLVARGAPRTAVRHPGRGRRRDDVPAGRTTTSGILEAAGLVELIEARRRRAPHRADPRLRRPARSSTPRSCSPAGTVVPRYCYAAEHLVATAGAIVRDVSRMQAVAGERRLLDVHDRIRRRLPLTGRRRGVHDRVLGGCRCRSPTVPRP